MVRHEKDPPPPIHKGIYRSPIYHSAYFVVIMIIENRFSYSVCLFVCFFLSQIISYTKVLLHSAKYLCELHGSDNAGGGKKQKYGSLRLLNP